jgi:dihydrofolate synthase/folylpolyglutamate synthase
MALPLPLTSYADVIAYLDNLGLFHMNLGLDRMHNALRNLDVCRLPCPVVQVVGTNGKGSVSTFLQSLAMAHGLKTGLYTSPHFLSPKERIRINHKELPEAAWPGLAEQALRAEPGLTYFELLTVMAVLAFRDAAPDLLIFEAGLGGSCDATTALPADMACFTPIALDHQSVLGPNLQSIAKDKAGAIRTGMFAAVSAPQKPEAWRQLARRAEILGIPLWCGTSPPDQKVRTLLKHPYAGLAATSPLGLAGPHQRANAQTSLFAWLLLCERYRWPSSEQAIRKGLAEAFIPGRLQTVPGHAGYPAFLLDGAHNTHGMLALAETVSAMPEPPAAIVFSCLNDKHPAELAAIIKSFAGHAAMFTPTIANNERALPGTELAALLGPQAIAVPDLPTALEKVRPLAVGKAPVLICGSLYLLAEFFTVFPSALSSH